MWEKGGRECKTVRMRSALFADDTTIVGMSGELNEGVRSVKSVMNEWEERNIDAVFFIGICGVTELVRPSGRWKRVS